MSSKTIKKLVRTEDIKLKNSSTSVLTSYDGEMYDSEEQCTGVANFFKKSYDVGKKIYKELNNNYNEAANRLYKQGIDEWDEEELKNRARYTGFFEEVIIMQKLREKKEQNSCNDE